LKRGYSNWFNDRLRKFILWNIKSYFKINKPTSEKINLLEKELIIKNGDVSQKEAEDFSNEKKILFHEVTEKTGDEIKELFNTIIFPEIARNLKLEMKKKPIMNQEKKRR
jgi:hypothetical protein